MRRYVTIGPAWWLLVLALLWASYARAAPLTTEQLGVLKADILASPDFADELAAGDQVALAAAYNVTATPDFWAWKTNLRQYDIYSLPSPTGSNWDWTVYKALTVQEQQTWKEMFQGSGAVTNYSLANIRAGVAALFIGAPPNTAQKAHIDAHGRRLVTRGEKLFTSGNGTTASPGLLGWEGVITTTDISNALALP